MATHITYDAQYVDMFIQQRGWNELQLLYKQLLFICKHVAILEFTMYYGTDVNILFIVYTCKTTQPLEIKGINRDSDESINKFNFQKKPCAYGSFHVYILYVTQYMATFAFALFN